MAYTIISESYGRRLPKITATADSTDDLAALGTNYAEGSTVNVGGTTYSLDKVSGWIIPGSGGGGGGGGVVAILTPSEANDGTYVCDHTEAELIAAFDAGQPVIMYVMRAIGKPYSAPLDFNNIDGSDTTIYGFIGLYGGIGQSGPIINADLFAVSDNVWSITYTVKWDATLVT